MFVLRFFAGPIVHRISPLGLLCACAAIAALGLYWLSTADPKLPLMIFAAATCYGVGKTFFWPTTLGVVAERFPKGGALTLNSIAGVGMLAAGIVGTPFLGYLQDTGTVDRLVAANETVIVDEFVVDRQWVFGDYKAIDADKLKVLSAEATEGNASAEQTVGVINNFVTQAKKGALATAAILPCIMFVCYVILILYFKSQGGYKAEVLVGHRADDEKFTGGVAGPVE
jgi:MFS family permease